MIDPGFLRDELYDAAEMYDLTQEEASKLSALSDDIIQETIMSYADDTFWEILDMMRSQAIRMLATEHLNNENW